ncbi:CPBP family intramembrane glutamic endopeptidase [Natrinema sp. SYSU A 869]|uniref:CPBP family intramembrane glutamic endopeptidase n=1 Tax=Natrinema sp. SYSU A 869 TaxID=2871694 RepID=UPI001CA4327D|nr:CPBP family intramembrane glutamic endopeptidase [Natrinema sp. SYSU A 869]
MSDGVAFLIVGATLIVVMAILWWWLDPREWTAAFPFRSPSATEVGWALAFVPLGFVTVQFVTAAMAPLGFNFTGPNYDLTDPVIAAGVLVGPLLLAPIFEEALVRGLLLGSLLDRGLSPTAAGLVTILVFAIPHIWLGVAGVVGLAAWAVFPTILRFRFNNLTGAALLHFLNNVIAYVVLVTFSF